MQLPRAVFLLRGQMSERIHAIQHLLPLLRRQAVEPIQLILQTLLLLRWKAAELRIILQRLFLLFRRQILVLAQPLSGVTVLLTFWRAGHRVRGVFLRMMALRQAWSSAG